MENKARSLGIYTKRYEELDKIIKKVQKYFLAPRQGKNRCPAPFNPF